MALRTIGPLGLALCQMHETGEHASRPLYSLPLFSTLGLLAVIHSQDLWGIYLGLELTLLPLLVWFGEGIAASRAREVLAKAYFSGVCGSLFLLLGIVLAYSGTGQHTITEAFLVESNAPLSSLTILGRWFFLAGVAIKMGWVPFYLSDPDIYEGGQAVATGFWAAITKLVGVLLLIRFVTGAGESMVLGWSQLLGIAALLAVLVGPLQALQQTNLKRRLAYGAVGQVGFLLLGLAAATRGGVLQENALVATLAYLCALIILSMGAMGVIVALGRYGDEPLEITEYSGLAALQPWWAAALSLFLLGLAGLPTTIGFVGILSVLRVTFDAGLIGFGIVVMIGWALTVYAAIQVIQIFYLKPPRRPRPARSGYPLIVAVFSCALLSVYWGLFPSSLLLVIRDSVRALLY